MNFIDEISVKGYNYEYIQYDPMLGIKNYLILDQCKGRVEMLVWTNQSSPKYRWSADFVLIAF